MITKSNPKEFQEYLSDASQLKGNASRLVLPENEHDVIEVLRECQREKTSLTVSASRTGLTGAAVPNGGVVMGMCGMNRIKAIESDFAVLEPGVTLEMLYQALKRKKLFYPPDPGEWKASIGGNVATNASGPRAFKYGSTREWIMGLRVVLPTGETIFVRRGECRAHQGILKVKTLRGDIKEIHLPNFRSSNRSLTKNAAGYFIHPQMDVVDLFIGAEGTLGIVTEIIVKLLPLPPQVLALMMFFQDEKEAWSFVRAVKRIAPKKGKNKNGAQLNPRAIEYMDERSLRFLREDYPHIPKHAHGLIFIEQEIGSEAVRGRIMNKWYDLVRSYNGLAAETWVASTEELHEEFHTFRYALPFKVSQWLKTHGQTKIGTDLAAPASVFYSLLDFQVAALEKESLHFVNFGHIGDGHLHLNILPANDTERQKGLALAERFVRETVKRGGTVSGEHGIGKLKRKFFKEMVGVKVLQEMIAMKKAFDPNGILNRGNLFAEDLLV